MGGYGKGGIIHLLLVMRIQHSHAQDRRLLATALALALGSKYAEGHAIL